MPFRFLIPLIAATACVVERSPLTNRMSHATTSYLARAARQPVGWQPWGREAFALAERLDRPVLLYVGAQDCRWCSVMDREVYGDRALGALIDSLFVPVRVDRDERPDVARRYQAAVQALAGLRGLPLTVFLTPEGSAFFGGTYFPADDPVSGRGLRQILPEVARSYREQRAFVERHAALVGQLAAGRSALSHGVLRADALRFEIGTVRGAIEVVVGRPALLGSVPHTQAVALLFREYALSADSGALHTATVALEFLLDSIASHNGGEREDPPDLVHAGLLRALALAWAVTAEPRYRSAGQALARALAADFTRPDRRPIFTDQAAYRIAVVLDGAPALGDTLSAERARAALDALLRVVYQPRRPVRHLAGDDATALLQDQVQITIACLAAHDFTGDVRYLNVARDLAAMLDREFADPLGGYFDVAQADPAAPYRAERTKQVLDDVLPGANAAAAAGLLRLFRATGDSSYRRRAEAVLEAFAAGVGGEGVRAATYLTVAREALAGR
ncbi:MAG: DUF255 domain-containing protein [Gemmatimonadales bacterium]